MIILEQVKNNFPERLVFLRKQNNLSQYQFAEKLGCSRGLIANYEQGRREPDYNMLLTIASFFRVSVDYLLGKSEKVEYSYSDDDLEVLKSVRSLKGESQLDLRKYLELLQLKDLTTTRTEKKK